MVGYSAVGCVGALRSVGAAAVVAMLVGCGYDSSPTERGGETPVVRVMQPEVRDLPNELAFAGRISASQEVQVLSTANGLLISVAAYTGGESADFEEGKPVQKGDVLFVVARNVALASEFFAAEAAWQRAQRPPQPASKKPDADAAAAVAQAHDRLLEVVAKLDCLPILAPIAGVIGRRLVDAGNYVQADQRVALGVIRATEDVRVDFHINERQMLELQRQGGAESSRGDTGRSNGWEALRRTVYVKLSDGTDCGQGPIDFVDNQVDPNLGGIAARATLPNRSALLYPGMSVQVRLPLEPTRGALLVLEQAIASDRVGSYLLVVDQQQIVRRRRVELGPSLRELRVVQDARGTDSPDRLTHQDRYITAGLDRVRVGQVVRVVSVAQADRE